MKQRNTDIDWIRAILIILMILIHIVSFGNAYPQLKAGILSFMMPTFLIITGYLVNIEKSPKGDGKIPDVSRFALRHHGNRFLCTLLFHARKRWHHGIILLTDLREDIRHIHWSLLVYPDDDYLWHSLLYQFQGSYLGNLKQGKTTMSTTTSLFIFATLLLLASKTPALSPSAASLLFHRYGNSPMPYRFGKIFRPSPAALLLWFSLLGLEEWYDWGCLAVIFSCWCCISSLMWIHSLITRFKAKSTFKR